MQTRCWEKNTLLNIYDCQGMRPGAQLLFWVQLSEDDVVSTWYQRFSPITEVISFFAFTTMLRKAISHAHERRITDKLSLWTNANRKARCLFYCWISFLLPYNHQKKKINSHMGFILSRLGNDTSGWGTGAARRTSRFILFKKCSVHSEPVNSFDEWL